MQHEHDMQTEDVRPVEVLETAVDEFAEQERKAMTRSVGYLHINGGVKFYRNENEPAPSDRTPMPRNRHERRAARACSRRNEPPHKQRC
jgi:hypothetical protein